MNVIGSFCFKFYSVFSALAKKMIRLYIPNCAFSEKTDNKFSCCLTSYHYLLLARRSHWSTTIPIGLDSHIKNSELRKDKINSHEESELFGTALTREPPQLIPSVWAHIVLIGRAHRVDEKPRRIHPIAALIQNYSRFTVILAYDKVCTEKSNDDIST